MSARPSVQPLRTAVIAMDFQRDIVGEDGAFAPLFHAEVARTGVITTAGRLLSSARAAGMKVVYSRAAFQPGYPELVANIPVLGMTAEKGCLIDGSDGAAIVAEVAPQDGEVILAHPRVSGFHGTALDVILRGAGIDTIVLMGVATNLAIESTARAGADLGYRTLVVADACSTVSEAAHTASLESLAMLAEIVTSDDLLSLAA
ncbi:MAG: isochorismatase family cysteine hydrolase [Mycobacterium sp.]